MSYRCVVAVVTLTKRVFLMMIVVCLLLSNSLLSIAYAGPDKQEVVEKGWEEVGGIEVLTIRPTAAGYMLDFRYKVVDPKKASLFLDRGNRPLLNVLKNGLTLQVPSTAKIGPLRQSAQLAKMGKNYFMFFGNPARMVKTGDEVQIQIGDFKSKILKVE